MAEKLDLQSSGKILYLSSYEFWGSQVKGHYYYNQINI
jgi:hypothetical protein